MAKKPVARSVESLKVLLSQINALAPNRSKVSDGWIGDAKHAARHSDHNPEPDGTVDARDFTNDPNGGLDSQKLCDALVASKDPRISYIICNGKIISGRKGPKPWTPRKYTGANGHYHHIHVSVLDEGQDDKTPWKIESAFSKEPVKPTDLGLTQKQVSSVLKKGSKGEFVEELQKKLIKLGYNVGPDGADGIFGDDTEIAVKKFQIEALLDPVDGWAGPKTMAAIGEHLSILTMQPKVDKARSAAAEAQDKAAQAEVKVDIAKKVVDDTAAGGKVSTTEWLTGLVGAGGTVSVIKEVADSVSETTQSVMSLGPWILLGLIIVSGAGYIIYDRRQKRLEAVQIKKVI